MGESRPSFYDILGVDARATSDEIRVAWKARITDQHPDRASPANAESAAARASAINEAYQTLSDPQQRAKYDARSGSKPTMGRPSEEAIEDFVRLRRERRRERLRVTAVATFGLAAALYTLRALRLLDV